MARNPVDGYLREVESWLNRSLSKNENEHAKRCFVNGFAARRAANEINDMCNRTAGPSGKEIE